MNYKRVLLLLLLLFLGIAPVWGTDFRVTISTTDFEELSPANANLANNIFESIWRELVSIPSYTPTLEEKHNLRMIRYKRKLNRLQDELRDLQSKKERTELSISSGERILLDEAIEKKAKEIEKFSAPSETKLLEGEAWDLVYLQDEQNTPMEMPTRISPELLNIFLEQQYADAGIFLSFQEIQNTLWCQLEFYNRLTGEVTILYGDFIISTTGEINEISFVMPIRNTLLGDRPWSQLEVHNPVPSLAVTITYEGSSESFTYGAGDTALAYLKPGKISVALSGYEYLPISYETELQEQLSTHISGALVKDPGFTFYLNTFAPDTRIYRNEHFYGYGTQDVMHVSLPGTIRLTNGVNELTFLLQDVTNPYLSGEVLDPGVSYLDIRNQRKEQFYRSFAVFLLSLPLTFLSSTMQSEYRRVEDTGSHREEFWNVMFYTSIGINAISGIQFFVDLFQFINSEDLVYIRE